MRNYVSMRWLVHMCLHWYSPNYTCLTWMCDCCRYWQTCVCTEVPGRFSLYCMVQAWPRVGLTQKHSWYHWSKQTSSKSRLLEGDASCLAILVRSSPKFRRSHMETVDRSFGTAKASKYCFNNQAKLGQEQEFWSRPSTGLTFWSFITTRSSFTGVVLQMYLHVQWLFVVLSKHGWVDRLLWHLHYVYTILIGSKYFQRLVIEWYSEKKMHVFLKGSYITR